MHAAVARSTLPSENVKNTTCTDHSWKLRCRKSARRCGAKHIFNWRSRTFGSWDVEKVDAVVARSTFPNQNVQSTTRTDNFWRFRCGFGWQAQGIVNFTKSEQKWGFVAISATTTNALHYTKLNYTTTHYTPVHSTPLHSTTLHCTTVRSTTLDSTPLHSTPPHYTALQYAPQH